MPMRWTPENDQLLLLKILETHELSVDGNKVAAAWPGTDPNEKPTARAIKERLFKMRQTIKASGGNGFSIGGKATSKTSTPKKAKNPTTPVKTPGSGKRKRADKAGLPGDGNEDTEARDEGGAHHLVKAEMQDDEVDTPTKKKPQRPAFSGTKPQMYPGFIKSERVDGSVFSAGVQDTPSKRSRRASVLPPGMVSYDDDEQADGDYESSSSEFLPEESVVKAEDPDMMAFA